MSDERERVARAICPLNLRQTHRQHADNDSLPAAQLRFHRPRLGFTRGLGCQHVFDLDALSANRG